MKKEKMEFHPLRSEGEEVATGSVLLQKNIAKRDGLWEERKTIVFD